MLLIISTTEILEGKPISLAQQTFKRRFPKNQARGSLADGEKEPRRE